MNDTKSKQEEERQGEMFETFWQLYPKKVAKKDAQKAWKKLNEQQQQKAVDALPAHCKLWDDQQFIPYPASWLNGERFEDEIQEPQKKAPKVIQVAWWSSSGGIVAKGREIGLNARPGESEQEFKQRIINKMQVAA